MNNEEIIDKINMKRITLQGGSGSFCLSQNKDSASFQDIISAMDETRKDERANAKCPTCNEDFNDHLCKKDVVEKYIEELREKQAQTTGYLVDMHLESTSNISKEVILHIRYFDLNGKPCELILTNIPIGEKNSKR